MESIDIMWVYFLGSGFRKIWKVKAGAVLDFFKQNPIANGQV